MAQPALKKNQAPKTTQQITKVNKTFVEFALEQKKKVLQMKMELLIS